MNLIFACDLNGAIGKDNALLWHIPEDLKFFKLFTTDNTVIMGRKTWESLPMYPKGLPNRKNIVLSKTLINTTNSDILIINDLENYLKTIRTRNDIFVIGGAEIYNLALPYCRFVYRTLVKTEIQDADTFFNVGDEFEVINTLELNTEVYDCEIQLLKRK